MAGLQAIVLLLLAAVCWWSGCTLAQLDKKMLLEVHNRARSNVSPPAKNMLKMEWNDELAQIAHSYAQKCQFDSNQDRHAQVKTSNFTQIGEIIHVFSGLITALDYTKVIDEWIEGKQYYNEREQSCDDDKKIECESYIQLVSARTYAVGCGVAECDENSILVCNYGPIFNIIDEPPYATGEPCSECPEQYHECEQHLCSKIPAGDKDCAPLHSEQCFCVDAQVTITCDGENSDMCNEGMQSSKITRCFCYNIDVSTRKKFTPTF